jgi:hypothetical protein
MGVYPLIEPRQRSVGNVTPYRLLDYVADHFHQLPFGKRWVCLGNVLALGES